MKLISQSFETPVTEDYNWLTDTFVSDDGTEQRKSLLDPPRRVLNATYAFTTESDARALVRQMFVAQVGFQIPAWHLAAKIAPAAIGDTAVLFDPLKTELRDGAPAALYDARSGALAAVTIAAVDGTGASLAAPLAAAWGASARIAPLWTMFGNDNASISRGNTHDNVTANLSLRSLEFIDPFLNPFNTSELSMFGGLPLLVKKPMGSNFDVAFNTGATLIDYGAAVTIRSRWQHSQEQFARDFLCQRVFNPQDWYDWQAFFDYCKGACNPFYMPTFRPDFGIVGTVAGATATFKGLDYGQDFFPFAAFKQFSFFTRGGRHDATVTGVAFVGGNTVCTINPPLPGGEDFAANQIASLLLKCRIADDKVSLSHDFLQTVVTLNIRTVDA